TQDPTTQRINSAGRGPVELPGGRLGSLVRPCHLDRYARSARPEVACRYRTGRVALGETARLKIVPQVRQEGKGVPARQPGSRGAPAMSGPFPLPFIRAFARLAGARRFNFYRDQMEVKFESRVGEPWESWLRLKYAMADYWSGEP